MRKPSWTRLAPCGSTWGQVPFAAICRTEQATQNALRFQIAVTCLRTWQRRSGRQKARQTDCRTALGGTARGEATGMEHVRVLGVGGPLPLARANVEGRHVAGGGRLSLMCFQLHCLRQRVQHAHVRMIPSARSSGAHMHCVHSLRPDTQVAHAAACPRSAASPPTSPAVNQVPRPHGLAPAIKQVKQVHGPYQLGCHASTELLME